MNHDELIQTIKDSVQSSVKETVNGKIDRVKQDIRWIRTIFIICLPIIISMFSWVAISIMNNDVKIATNTTEIGDIISSINLKR